MSKKINISGGQGLGYNQTGNIGIAHMSGGLISGNAKEDEVICG